MSKLYYGDAVTRIRNAGFEPEAIRNPRKSIIGIRVWIDEIKLEISPDNVGLYNEDDVACMIGNALGWRKDNDKYRHDPRYGG
jgi:hypothetical protein